MSVDKTSTKANTAEIIRTRAARAEISPYTRKMLRIEVVMKILLGICSVLVVGFLLVLISYLSFRGLFIRSDIQSAILPDYRESFSWPAEPDGGESISLWVSSAVELGKLRGDELHDILSGKEKNWVGLAESGERLTVLLTERQLESLEETNTAAGVHWRKSRNIKAGQDYDAVAAALLETPGAMAFLPASWNREDWEGRRPAGGHKNKIPRRVSLADRSLLLHSRGLALASTSGLEKKERGQGDTKSTEYSVPLNTAKDLLENQSGEEAGRKARTASYNWLTGLPGTDSEELLAQGYVPVRLFYREYEILKLSFLLEAPAKNGKVGGISTMIFSSLILIFVSLLWSIPLGLAVVVFLVEYAQTGARSRKQRKWQNRFANTVDMAIQTLSGIPSIIFGLFGSILFVPLFGIGLLSGAATLVLMLLPTIILTAKEALLTVPRSYVEASLGLGAQKWYTILHISLPNALPGILAGIILAIGRALGETAALIYTLGTGYQAALSRFPQLLGDWPVLWQEFWLSPGLGKLARIADSYPLLDLHSSLRSISLHLYWMTINGISLQKGFSTAFILIFLIVLLNMGARALLTRFSHKHQALS
ncbi:phosphate ABC transporter permease PstA [Candidatus Haliotispira prima]|uniref:Phosphate transport system permease protein PstA n=1 Tax=Candidatus Haliotispira prima TaxID=3034016 RepID=A0ABY8MGV1_9SPIO|nr:phosphate ABC transporter permease PstA [Candidatus Haliotispira prima]